MRSLLRLHIYLPPYWQQVATSLTLLLVLTSNSLVIPEIIQRVIDAGLKQADISYLNTLAVVLLGIGAVNTTLTYFQRYLSQWIASHIGYYLRNRLFDHIQPLSFS
jgi:ABC-type bacteriocin/lantibiotic exporter with double-glycine peptidase domain